MKTSLLLIIILSVASFKASGQELYVNTEPASNMAAHSLGIRLENQGFFYPEYKTRSTLEAMYGASKNWMLHASIYASDYDQPGMRFEGAGLYAKYRFVAIDSVQRHFRGAVFAKVTGISNPVNTQEINLEGDNSGFQSGVVFTQLIHKLAVSGSASYLHALNNLEDYSVPIGYPHDALGYTLSAGYLLFPETYYDYKQVNVNIYAELLGKVNPGYSQSYLDFAPAIQFIFNSVFRVDLSYRTPLYNDMMRNSRNNYLVRLEYNFFNLF